MDKHFEEQVGKNFIKKNWETKFWKNNFIKKIGKYNFEKIIL